MVALLSPVLAAALLAGVPLAVIIAAFLAGPGGGDTAAIVEWLYSQGLDTILVSVLSDLLERIWREGWQLGQEAARQVLGLSGYLPGQLLDDLLNSLGYDWTAQIARTLIEGIARILGEGGTQAAIEARLKAFLTDPVNAQRIVQTELTRAINAAAVALYQSKQVYLVRWLTEHDARVCPECDANQAAGPWPLGQPFPSGAIAPPQHPRCRCALIPA